MAEAMFTRDRFQTDPNGSIVASYADVLCVRHTLLPHVGEERVTSPKTRLRRRLKWIRSEVRSDQPSVYTGPFWNRPD